MPKRNHERSTLLTACFPAEMTKAVDSYAQLRNISISSAIIQIVRLGLQHLGTEDNQTGTTAPTESVEPQDKSPLVPLFDWSTTPPTELPHQNGRISRRDADELLRRYPAKGVLR